VPRVFICYRGADAKLAERLASELKTKGGHDVWLDRWEIEAGDSIVGRINEGLSGNIALILCVSSAGPSSWTESEWNSVFARKLNGETVKVLPALLTGREIPSFMRHIKFANLIDDWDAGVAALLKALARP